MKYILKHISLFIIIIPFLSLNAQVAVGQWRDHMNYNSGIKVVFAGPKTYCLSTGGLFSISLVDDNIERYSKVQGLSDVNAKTIEYAWEYGYLIVGYENGNIDLIKENTVYNIPDIKNKALNSSKIINNLLIINQFVYISTDFGIVVLDLIKKEIKDTYVIGTGGTYLGINDLDVDNTWIYAATGKGIYKALRSNPNLVDFSNWQRIEDLPNYNKKCKGIKVFKDELYAFFDYDEWDKDTIYRRTDSGWVHFVPNIKNIVTIDVKNYNLVVIEYYTIYMLDYALNELYYYNYYPNNSPAHATTDVYGNLWIADKINGFFYKKNSGQITRLVPNGPIDLGYTVFSENNKVVLTAGGKANFLDNMWKDAKFSMLDNDIWHNFSKLNYPELDSLKDIVNAAINPKNDNQYFLGTFGRGIIEMNGTEIVKIHNEYNSSLQNIYSPGQPYIKIGGMCIDNDQNLWVTNLGVDNQISVKKANGSWKGFNLKNQVNAETIDKIINTKNNHKWVIILRGGGLFAFSDNNTIDNESDDQFIKFSVLDQNGELISNDIYSIAEDKDGYIWLGTNKGVVVYYSPENVFSNENFYGSQIKIPNENPGQANYLLESQTITAIAVDGANRKWFATLNGGVFLMSADGTEELLHFTSENSPLYSDVVLDLCINKETGEVFMVTDAGTISYKGTATEGDDYFRHVYAYPNPVQPGYSGWISIKGLAANVDVKVTDVSGNLVFQTTSFGGQAIWDGNALDGRRVQSGVYLVFTSSQDGTKKHITKLLFLN